MKRWFHSNYWFTVVVTLLAALFVLSGARPVLADGTVENCNDDSAFNSVVGSGGLVNFDCGGNGSTATITLSHTYTIPTNTTIDGGGKVTLSGAHALRLFVVNNGVTLTLKNVVLANGYGSTSDGGTIYNSGHLILDSTTIQDAGNSNFYGGAIATVGALDVTNSAFINNKGGSGGAIYANGSSAQVTITGSTFHENSVSSSDPNSKRGGALYVSGGATVNLFASDMYSNTAASGGGIYNENSTLTVQDVRIHDNTVSVKGGGILNAGTANLFDVTLNHNNAVNIALGGGIYNYGDLTLADVTLNNNTAYDGGGMSNAFATAKLTNVTLSGNSVTAYGGAIDNIAATLTLTNVTLSDNSAGSSGGSIINENTANTHLNLKNVIVANSKVGPNCYFQTAPDSSDHNLSSDATCNFGTGRDNVKLKLGPLETNGGATLTHRLLPGSKAIDAGVFVNSILTDQRGTTRPRGTAFDVGSLEFIPCTGTPTKSQMLSPANKSTVGTPEVLLDWAGPDCVKTFGVVVRQDTKSGPIVFSKSKIKPSQVLTPTLATGHKYYWQVTACYGANCVTSSWAKFKLQ